MQRWRVPIYIYSGGSTINTSIYANGVQYVSGGNILAGGFQYVDGSSVSDLLLQVNNIVSGGIVNSVTSNNTE